MINSAFENNSAIQGLILYINRTFDVELENLRFNYNGNVTKNQGTVQIINSYRIKINNSQFIENRAMF